MTSFMSSTTFITFPSESNTKKFLFHHVTAITVFSPIFMKSKISIIVFIIYTKGFPTYSFITIRVFKIMPFKIDPYSCHSFCLRWSFVAPVVFDSIVTLEEVLYSLLEILKIITTTRKINTAIHCRRSLFFLFCM